MSVSGGSATEASLPIVASSTTYSIEVAAVNSAGVGVYCDPITAGEQGQLTVHILQRVLSTGVYIIIGQGRNFPSKHYSFLPK